MEVAKKCGTCGEVKPHGEFYRSQQSKDGLRYQCKACTTEQRKQWRDDNPDKFKAQRKRNKKRRQAAGTFKKWKSKRPMSAKALLDRDIRLVLNADMRSVLLHGKTVYEMLGYTAHDLIAHIEPQLNDGMTWENYGVKGWHLDHVYPVSLGDYDSPANTSFKNVWSLANLQPLWAAENIAKGAQPPTAMAA